MSNNDNDFGRMVGQARGMIAHYGSSEFPDGTEAVRRAQSRVLDALLSGSDEATAHTALVTAMGALDWDEARRLLGIMDRQGEEATANGAVVRWLAGETSRAFMDSQGGGLDGLDA